MLEGIQRNIAYLRSDDDVWGGLILTLCLAVLAFFVVRLVARRLVARALSAQGHGEWYDVLIHRRVFSLFALFAPMVMLSFGLTFFNLHTRLGIPEVVDLWDIVVNGVDALSLLLVIALIDRLLVCLLEIHETSAVARERPIKSVVEFFRILNVCVGAVMVGTLAVGESVMAVLGGIGAFSAVLMFVFRDTVQSFIGGLQLSSSGAVHKGDWIECPDLGLDGDVIDIALHAIKIRNFDKTISSVPTWRLAATPFKNWRGMREFGGRRFTRAVVVAKDSIRFLGADDLDGYDGIPLIQEYLAERRERIRDFQARRGHSVSEMDLLNGPFITNVDLFSEYVRGFLASDSRIHAGGTNMVRQLPPLATGGLPVEIYAFVNETEWIRYEEIVAEIYAHFLAAARHFDLSVHTIRG